MHWGPLDRRRRKLPHWRAAGATYFVTWSLIRSQQDLRPAERSLVADTLRHFEGARYELVAWVVMNDHVHVIVRPFAEWDLSSVLHSWKSFTAHEMVKKHRRSAPVWLKESYERIVRGPHELAKFTRYVQLNPRRRWPERVSYEWVFPAGRAPGGTHAEP